MITQMIILLKQEKMVRQEKIREKKAKIDGEKELLHKKNKAPLQRLFLNVS
jgi:hypothetical protein